MENNTQKFSGKAAAYTKGRPAYAQDCINALFAEYGLSETSVIADIGCGTGKLAQQLLEKGCAVYGVEPNDDMRNAATENLSRYPKFTAVNGADKDTTLPADSVDFITVAQAFHWFDTTAFRAECNRMLKSGGKVILLWNLRDMNAPEHQKCRAVYERFCPAFHGFGGGIQEDDKRIKDFFNNAYDSLSFDNPVLYNRETFIDRSLSGSYSLTPDDADYPTYIKSLTDIFDEHAENGALRLPYKTVAYIGH